MGSDDIHKKRKARKAKAAKRKSGTRESYDKVLIVCEGEKTEPNYLNELITIHKLSSANIVVRGIGEDPLSIVKKAKELYDSERRRGDAYDRVYCVFDKDQHATYGDALQSIEASQKYPIYGVNSVPCFEYWILLHFRHTTKPYEDIKGKTAAEQVLSEVKDYFPAYSKGMKNVYSSLEGQLEYAKANSKRAIDAASKQHTDNPTTMMHEIVDYLQCIKG